MLEIIIRASFPLTESPDALSAAYLVSQGLVGPLGEAGVVVHSITVEQTDA